MQAPPMFTSKTQLIVHSYVFSCLLYYYPKYLNIYLYIRLDIRVKDDAMDFIGRVAAFASGAGRVAKYVLVPFAVFTLLFTGYAYGAVANASLISELSYVKEVLTQVGPILSGVLFVVAGIFYAIGQLLPPDKRANFHTTAINIIIGAIVVGVLSVASTSLATASTHLLSNATANASV